MGVTEKFYDDAYRSAGFDAQRRYPNEELCRFMGRRLFGIPRSKRKSVRVLEVGCGSGANLWMIAAEGFDTHGIDLSAEGVSLCSQMLSNRGLKARLTVGDMADTKLRAHSFDVIVDVFSSYCLDEVGYLKFIQEVKRLLKTDGHFFSYTPSQSSEAFNNYAPASKIDASTLDSIKRKDSPFTGQDYPFRFETTECVESLWQEAGFHLDYSETVGRTYEHLKEYFEFLVFETSLEKHPSLVP